MIVIEKVREEIMKIIPEVPIVYGNKFPEDFVNDVNGWAFSKEMLLENTGKLLTLDIDFGNHCDLDCPHCFKRNNRGSRKDKKQPTKKKELAYGDVLDIIKQGKELGLKSVKVLGAGEPFLEREFLKFLRELKELDIIPLVFTKGNIIGDDELVKKYFSLYGVSTGEELVQELKKCNVSVLLGFNSFDSKVQDRMVGGVEGYTLRRNRVLKLLVEAGFNSTNPTHLCLAANPVTNDNYNEILEIYKWGRLRNMYVIVCPTMISGRTASDKVWSKLTPSTVQLVNLYTEIYKFNIENGIQTLDQIKLEGIASYAGGHPCNQVSCGMYVTIYGTVLRCPGDDTTIPGNIWEESLREIWIRSENYGRSGTFNCGCPPKFGKSIPFNLFTDVLLNLEKWQRQS